MREAGRCAYAMPTPGVVWQLVGAPVMQISLLVSPLVPSTAPRTWKAADQGRKLGVGGGTGKEQSSAAVSEQVGGLTDCTQPGSGLEWRPPALAGLESLLGVAGGRCVLLARQVLVAGSTHRGSGLLATTTVKAVRALPIVPTLHRRPEEESPAACSVLSRIS